MTISPLLPTASAAGADLSPEAIERSLQELWREAEEAEVDVTQVRMLNLLVYLPTPPAPEIRSAITAVAARHPGRTISLFYDDGLPHAAATIVCRAGEGRQHACGELISLHGSVNGQPLHSLAVALLQAGLPVTLWWHGLLDFDDHLFRQLTNVADRVVVDSRSWTDRLTLLPRLARLSDEWSPRFQFGDLQWGALTGWRRIIAHCFDVPGARAALPDLETLTIEYGGSERLNIGALLVVGWLVSRLGWQLHPDSAVREQDEFALYAHRDTPAGARMRIVFLWRGGGEEGIRSVHMRAAGDQGAIFTFAFEPASRCVRTRIELASRAPIVQVSHLHQPDAAGLMSDEIALTTGDPVYQDALRVAGELAGSLNAVFLNR